MNDSNEKKRVAVLGASSLVGAFLLPMLKEANWKVLAYSRQQFEISDGTEWITLKSEPRYDKNENIPFWICLAPIWVLPDYFEMILQSGARRIVVLSSTSIFAKAHSPDVAERFLVRNMQEGEERIRAWANTHEIEWVILRPTLIYGKCLDKNITEIARFIRRFGFFPLLGHGQGLRQPIHAQDVAQCCLKTLTATTATNQAYNISGKEILPYREMVQRVFTASGRTPRFISVPLWIFRIAVACVRLLPRYRKWSPAMVQRMNQDLVFDHAEAIRDFGFAPQAFTLTPDDVAR